jgi:hypothetical protein
MRIFILALLLYSCGPPPAPHGRYHGELASGGFQYDCTLEITPTSLDRVHIHVDYANQCDGDGAYIAGDLLLPDAGGEITFDGYTLSGSLYSAIGNQYDITASPEGARYVSPGQRPGYGPAPTPIIKP